jgi:hypothetical protein
MLTSRTAYRISFAAGLAVLILAIVGATAKPITVCGELPANYAPIIAFELVRSISDLEKIFGTELSECRANVISQLDSINRIDVWIYIPLYGSFLIFFLLGLRGEQPRIARVAAYIAGGACIADYFENVFLFRLTSNLAASVAETPEVIRSISALFVSTEAKWIGLGLASLLGGYALTNRGGWWRLGIAPCALGLIAALITIPAPALAGPYLSQALAMGWLIFLFIAARESFRTANTR